MNERPRGIGSYISANRASALELALVVLAAALGVNLVAGFLSGVLPKWAILALGIVLICASLGVLVWLRLKPVNFDTQIRGFVLYDGESNKLLTVDGYKLAEQATRLLTSAFAEDAALQKQWTSAPLSELSPASNSKSAGKKSKKLVQELLEYMLLEKLSVHLSDFFRSYKSESADLSNYTRNDVPQVLLANRFLELFSRNPEDRAAFLDDDDDDTEGQEKKPENWVLVSGSSRSGAYYNHFDLTLPADSTLSRTPSGDIQIDGPVMSVGIQVRFEGFWTNIPFPFLRHYLKRPFFDSDLRPLQVIINVQIKVHKQLFTTKKALKYSDWVEKFLKGLEQDYSKDNFFSRIGWPQLEAYLKIVDESEIPATTKSRPHTID